MAEDTIIHLMEDSNLCAIHAKRVTISKCGEGREECMNVPMGHMVRGRNYPVCMKTLGGKVCPPSRAGIAFTEPPGQPTQQAPVVLRNFPRLCKLDVWHLCTVLGRAWPYVLIK